MQGRFANIIVDISHEKVDRPFQYRVPEALSGIPEPCLLYTSIWEQKSYLLL